MQELILHAATKAQLQGLRSKPSHAILLTGPDGVGKTASARALAVAILELDKKSLDNHPYFKLIKPDDKGTISIESVRGLQNFVRLKTTGRKTIRRLALVEHADGLTKEAQNAFLKILEEPPADTVLVLTATHTQALLPTILSRVQTVTVRSPDKREISKYFRERGTEEKLIEKAYFLSGGLPGLMHALLNDQADHPLLSSVDSAKTILKQNLYDRLCELDSLSKQRDEAHRQVDALLRIAQAGISQSVLRHEDSKIKSWHMLRKKALGAKNALDANANSKLVLTNLFLRL